MIQYYPVPINVWVMKCYVLCVPERRKFKDRIVAEIGVLPQTQHQRGVRCYLYSWCNQHLIFTIYFSNPIHYIVSII